jgi:hypothetical protein
MVYCVVRVGKGQCNGILMGGGLGKGSVMGYCVVSVGKGQCNGILCGEVWERAA